MILQSPGRMGKGQSVNREQYGVIFLAIKTIDKLSIRHIITPNTSKTSKRTSTPRTAVREQDAVGGSPARTMKLNGPRSCRVKGKPSSPSRDTPVTELGYNFSGQLLEMNRQSVPERVRLAPIPVHHHRDFFITNLIRVAPRTTRSSRSTDERVVVFPHPVPLPLGEGRGEGKGEKKR